MTVAAGAAAGSGAGAVAGTGTGAGAGPGAADVGTALSLQAARADRPAKGRTAMKCRREFMEVPLRSGDFVIARLTARLIVDRRGPWRQQAPDWPSAQACALPGKPLEAVRRRRSVPPPRPTPTAKSRRSHALALVNAEPGGVEASGGSSSARATPRRANWPRITGKAERPRGAAIALRACAALRLRPAEACRRPCGRRHRRPRLRRRGAWTPTKGDHVNVRCVQRRQRAVVRIAGMSFGQERQYGAATCHTLQIGTEGGSRHRVEQQRARQLFGREVVQPGTQPHGEGGSGR